MASALVPLANKTLTSTAGAISLTSISGSYRDLLVVLNVSTNSGIGQVTWTINSDSGMNYETVIMEGNGSTATSKARGSANAWNFHAADVDTYLTTNPSVILLNFMDYSATDKHKTVLSRFSSPTGTSSGVGAAAHRWASTSAITSIAFDFGSTLAIGSSIALYGVSA